MTDDEREFLAELSSSSSRALRAETRELVEKADAVLMRPMSDAYDELVADARSRVAKSGGERVSDDVAVARFLRTPQGRAAYVRYIEGRDRVAKAVSAADEESARRQHVEIVSERFLEGVEKAVASGEDRDSAVIRIFGDGVARALGLDLVRKSDVAAGAYEPIERAAAAVLRRRPSLSRAQAVDEALRENPGLYDDYQRARVNAGQPALNTGDGVGGGGELVGSADAAEEPAARPARRRREALDTGEAFVAKGEGDEHALWSAIVEKSGADETSDGFAKTVDDFLATDEGQRLYADYVAAFEARDTHERKGT